MPSLSSAPLDSIPPHRRLAVLLLLIAGQTGTAWAQKASSRENPVWADPDRSEPLGSQYFTFRSSAAQGRVSCLVWLPPAYTRQADQRFPVVYWLHGANGDQRKCAEAFLPPYIQALKERKTPPAIVVAVNGIPLSFYGDSQDGRCPVESVITRDLIPSIDRSFRTIATREGRLLEGFSMGGFGAARLGFKYPELFGAIAIDAGGPITPAGVIPPPLKHVFGDQVDELPIALAEKNAASLKQDTLIRIACGDKDNKSLDGCRALHHVLESFGIPHVYVELPGIGHEADRIYKAGNSLAFNFHRRAFSDRTSP